MFALRPEFCGELIAKARDKRAQTNKTGIPAQSLLNIGISRDWCNSLLAHPFTSSKCPGLRRLG